jgi:hypothetical protein
MGRNRVVASWQKMMAAKPPADRLFNVIVIVSSIQVRFAVLNIKHRFSCIMRVTIFVQG